MTCYVFSTLSTSVGVTEYDSNPPPNSPPKVKRCVIIKGGAGVADKFLQTPYGVVTKLSDDDAAFVAQSDLFQRYTKAGFMRMESHKHDIESVVADMKQRDNSAPLRPEDIAASEGAKLPAKAAA